MITITKDLKEAKYVTHSGNFHADDVFSTVFLEKLFGDITVIRLKEYKDDGTKIAYDIGCGKFDHHQVNSKIRDNGIHYCGFGLLWQEYGLEYLNKIDIKDKKETFKVVDYLLVTMIDAIDNGEFEINSEFNIYTLSSLIGLFRPKYKEEKDEDLCFIEAVHFASMVFDLIIKDAISKVEIINEIKKEIPNIKNRTLILKEYLPYEFAIFHLGIDNLIDFVVYPSNRGGYAVHTVPTRYKGYVPKVPLNQEWAGLRDEELVLKSGIKTAKFCHKNLFIATASTLKDALELIKKSINLRK